MGTPPGWGRAVAALCSLCSFNRGSVFRAPFSEYAVLQNQDVKKQEQTLGVAGLSGRRIQGHFAWTLHLGARDRTLPRSLQPEASGPGTGICTLNALEEPGRWPFGGASCDSCFLSQRRGPFRLKEGVPAVGCTAAAPARQEGRGTPAPWSPQARAPVPLLHPCPGLSLPASTALRSGSPPPLQITVEGPRGAVPTPDSPSDSRHRSPPPPAPVIPASQVRGPAHALPTSSPGLRLFLSGSRGSAG